MGVGVSKALSPFSELQNSASEMLEIDYDAAKRDYLLETRWCYQFLKKKKKKSETSTESVSRGEIENEKGGVNLNFLTNA